MKRSIFHIVITVIIGFIGIFRTFNSDAQFTKILDFNVTNGKFAGGNLYYDGTYLYGMTNGGGGNSDGLIYKIKPDGTSYTDLLDFNGTNGKNAVADLIYDGIYFYGMTLYGGTNNYGVVFKIKPDGTGDTVLLNFDGTNGKYPSGSLFYDGTWLYGVTQGGGLSNDGLIFKIKTDGTGYEDIHEFTNGEYPMAAPISDGNFLYGMTSDGGATDNGLVYKIKPDGSQYTVLYEFDGSTGDEPYGSLIYDGTWLYGMTQFGGVNNEGVIFKIMPDGTGYTKLLDFNSTNGALPMGTLIYDGTYLYGVTYGGGASDDGIIFEIMPDGTGYKDLFDFNGLNGNHPYASIITDGTYLYGTTMMGGTNSDGVVFRFKLSSCSGVSIDKEPSDTSICRNGTANFSVKAVGDGAISYQWQVSPGWANLSNDTLYNGVNTSTLSVNLMSDSLISALQYRCIVSNCKPATYTTSKTVTITLMTPVSINPSFYNKSICSGDTIKFALNVTDGTPPFAYQWLLNGIPVADATNSIYFKQGVDSTDGGKYSCIITNTCNEQTGDIVSLKVISDCNRTHHKITGYVIYDNTAMTPMSSKTALTYTKIYLYDTNNNIIDSCQTDDNGYYEFVNVINGAYYLSGKTNKAWRESLPSDALKINKNYIGLYNIPVSTTDSLYFKASDVFKNNKINPTDALMINRRYIGVINKFRVSDWIFEKISLDISKDVIQNIRVICAGDVAGGYEPPLKIRN